MNAPVNKSRAMQTIQTINTAQNRKHLVGKEKKREQSAKATRVQDKENIQRMGDKKKKIIHKTKKVNDEACDLMLNETIPPIYWEELAETRRLALVEVGKENEKLHEMFELLNAEYIRLKPMYERAVALEKLLMVILEERCTDEAEAED